MKGWKWRYGNTCTVAIFTSPTGIEFEREDYSPGDAWSLCDYLNSIGHGV